MLFHLCEKVNDKTFLSFLMVFFTVVRTVSFFRVHFISKEHEMGGCFHGKGSGEENQTCRLEFLLFGSTYWNDLSPVSANRDGTAFTECFSSRIDRSAEKGEKRS